MVYKPSIICCALFFCSKFVCGSKAEMVGPTTLTSNLAAVKALRGGDGPVAINLVSNFHLTVVVCSVVACEGQRSLVAEIVLETAVDGNGGSFDAISRFVGVPNFERVLDAISDGLVTSAGSNLPGDIGTGPVSLVLIVLRSVDDLRPALLHLRASEFQASTKVELIAEKKVKMRLDFDLTLLVVLSVDLYKNRELAISSVLFYSCRQIDFVRYLQDNNLIS